MRATGPTFGGKRVLAGGRDEVGRCCSLALRGAGGRGLDTEGDPICVLQACARGFLAVTVAEVVGELGVLTSAAGNIIVNAVELRWRLSLSTSRAPLVP